MLYFNKENTLSQNNNQQEIFSTFMLASFVIFNYFGSWCTDGTYSQNYMSDFTLFHSTISWWKFKTFMLTLLGILFRIWIIFGKV